MPPRPVLMLRMLIAFLAELFFHALSETIDLFREVFRQRAFVDDFSRQSLENLSASLSAPATTLALIRAWRSQGAAEPSWYSR